MAQAVVKAVVPVTATARCSSLHLLPLTHSLTPATPSSESNLSPSPRKPTPPHTPGDHTSQFDSDTVDSVLPSSSSESQAPSFPDVSLT